MKTSFFLVIMLLLFSIQTSFSQQNCWSLDKYPVIDPNALQDSANVIKVLEEWQQKYDLFYDGMVDCPMPKLNHLTISGDSITNKKLMGKVVVINFWSIDLPKYDNEIRRLDSMRQYFQDKDVVFIAIGKESKESITTYLKDKNFKFNIIPNGDKLSTNFANNGWPHTYIFDKQNRFKRIFDNVKSGGVQQNIQAIIEKLL